MHCLDYHDTLQPDYRLNVPEKTPKMREKERKSSQLVDVSAQDQVLLNMLQSLPNSNETLLSKI